ncbi:hypothetical protein AB669_18575 [Pedobacter sp. BMA]|nr:hypothetical protein AB669_18575 [Pedobacter sp. BMA]
MHVLNTKFVTIIITFLFFGLAKSDKHPLHVSTTEVNFNAKEKSLEISCRVFSDDFESILAKNYKQKTDLSNPAMKAAMDELVKKYILTHLSVNANGKSVKMSYLGFEMDHEATNIYLEVAKVSAVKSMEVTNTMLYDIFDDQMSIVHLVKGNVRKSTKILYPDKQFSANF